MQMAPWSPCSKTQRIGLQWQTNTTLASSPAPTSWSPPICPMPRLLCCSTFTIIEVWSRGACSTWPRVRAIYIQYRQGRDVGWYKLHNYYTLLPVWCVCRWSSTIVRTLYMHVHPREVVITTLLTPIKVFCKLHSIRKGWFSNTSFTTGLKTLPTFRPDALVFFTAKKCRQDFQPCCEAGIGEPTLSDA